MTASIAAALHLPPSSTHEQVVEHLHALVAELAYATENATGYRLPLRDTLDLTSALLIALDDVPRLEYLISQLASVRYAGDGKHYYYHRTDGKSIGKGYNARGAIDDGRNAIE